MLPIDADNVEQTARGLHYAVFLKPGPSQESPDSVSANALKEAGGCWSPASVSADYGAHVERRNVPRHPSFRIYGLLDL